MRIEPAIKRTIAFVDGQNLFNHAKAAFGYDYPNYDITRLAEMVCEKNHWHLQKIHFYTGIPDRKRQPEKHGFWSNKLRAMRNQGVEVYRRDLVYRSKTVDVPRYGPHTFEYGQEKGIDVRMALDALKATMSNELDVVLIFSQDQDLSELAAVVRTVSASIDRWVCIASAFPVGPSASTRQHIYGTRPCPFDKSLYDGCIDSADYRIRAT